MPQQINLCTPILLTQKRYFSAQTMGQALAIFVVLGAGLCAYWVWSLNVASEGFKKTLVLQARELEGLQSAIKQGRANVGPAETALKLEIQNQRSELQARENLLEELQRGLLRPGWGHAARLQLVAQSIPPQVWLTQVKADAYQLEVSGFTLEPVALNEWVSKLAASPLLKGQQLATVKVEIASDAMVNAMSGVVVALTATAPTAPTKRRPLWSFSFVSAVGSSAAVAEGSP